MKKQNGLFKKIVKIVKNKNYRSQFFYFFLKRYISVKENIILYESFHGSGISCNPKAIFEFLEKDKRFASYKHIWILNKPNLSDTKQYKNTTLIQRGSFLHAYYLVCAKYLINNNSFLPYVSKQKNQIYINTWHGTPIKKLGKDIPGMYASNRNVYRNLLQCDYFISPNKYTTEIFLKSNDIDTLFSGKIIENGYPRNDALFLSEERKFKLLKSLGIPEDKKVILYAPTFRGSHTNVDMQSNVYSDLVIYLQEHFKEYRVLTKLHHTQKNKELDISVISDTIDTNELLSIVDILITDYSSIAFDFLALKRPIIYYAFDLFEYERERGLYFSLKEMAGVVCGSKNEVLDEIKNIDSFMHRHNENYIQAIEKFSKYEDGKVTKRVIETIFLNTSKDTNIYTLEMTNKKTILLYAGGFLNNGITSSVVALLSQLNFVEYEVYLIFNGHSKEENYIRLLRNTPKEVKILYYVQGRNRLTQFLHKYGFINEDTLYKEEYYRIFGHTSFDIAIDYSGYGNFWPAVIGYSDCNAKYIYLHSDMKQESRKRAHLANFTLLESLYYNNYDKLITVSDSSYKANLANYPELKEKITVVNNPINAKKIIELSEIDSFDNNKVNFINIGRYSIEKGQDRLIEAFYRLSYDYENIHLYLVGHGPLHNKLNTLIAKYGLRDKITVTGNLDNPFPLLKKCDCFVLSSHYEGQGLVLIEALVLGVPCISTDIPGPASVLSNSKGLLVEDSVDGLVDGMSKYLEGNTSFTSFDDKEYSKSAMTSFYNTIG